MVGPLRAERVYNDGEPVGIAVLAGCGMLSLISVLGMFVFLGMSAIRSRRSSAETPFVRTHVATYILSLLICNLAQGIGALFDIQWIVEKRVYTGTLCTTQATITQIGNIGTAIFSFVIAAHTFSLLFLRHQWSDRTRYTILVASWGLLIFDMCLENLIVADREAKGPYYGISGYWCWITPAYSTDRYTSDYLFMFASAGFSFILCLLVFLRLRGNITTSAGYRVHFHRRPKFSARRASAGAYITAMDRRVESHLTTVAKQMLLYPLAYTVLVLPIGATRVSTISGASVPFAITIFTAAVLVLSGFVNTVLFCTTRSVLPGRWRQRSSIGTTLDDGRGDVTWGNSPLWRAESDTRRGTVYAGRPSFVIDISVEKDIEIKYDKEPSVSPLKFGYPTSPAEPTWPLRAYGGRRRADSYSSHIRRPSFPLLQDEGQRVCLEADGGDENSHFDEGAHPVSRRRERGVSEPTMGLEPPASVYPFPPTHSVNTDTQNPWSPSFLTFDAVGSHTRLSGGSGDFGGNGDGMYWTRYNEQQRQIMHTGMYYPAGDGHPYSAQYHGTESRHPAAY